MKHDPQAYLREADLLHIVPPLVGDLVQNALGKPAQMVLIVQTEYGGHLFTNDERTEDPEAMAQMLEHIVRLIRSGQGRHDKIGLPQ